MLVPNFEAMSLVSSVLGPENYLESLVQKVVLFKNSLNMAKNRYPFIPTNPLLATMSFFFFSFFLNLVRSSSAKPQHIKI